MIKNKTIWLLLFMLLFSMFPSNVADEQVWENEFGRIVVWPTTSRNLITQKQFYEVTWYKPSNTLDVAFRFDNPISRGGVFYWNGTSYKKLSVDHVEFNGKHYYVLENIFFNQDETKTGYWEYDTPVNSKGKWDMFVKLSSDSWQYAFNNNRYIHLDPWWNANWLGKKKLTLNSSQVPINLKNFPVLINLSDDADLAGNVGYSDGRDIAFVDSSESTQFNHEIEYFDDGDADLRAWVNVTTLGSGSDTEIYMYFDNSNCVNQSNITGVWDSDYLAVYHLEGPAWGNIDSSTWFGNISAVGGNPQYNQQGFFGRGVDFDGSGDYLETSDKNAWSFLNGHDDNFTIEAVVRKDDNTYNPIISKWPSGTAGREWFMWFNTDSPSELRLGVYDDTPNAQQQRDTQGIFDNSNWNYVVGVCHYSGATVDKDDLWLYNKSLNVSDVGSPANAYVIKRNSGSPVRIGHKGHAGGNYYLNGLIDELRVSSIVRNESWITACYNNLWNASDGGFFDVGAYEYTANVEEPTNFVAVTDSIDGSIDLSWTLGLNATDTRVEYNTVSVWTRGNGNFLYNGSGLSASLTTGTCGTLYYFKGWSWNDTSKSWGTYNTTDNISCPGDPTSVDSVSYPSALNITWTTNTHADSTALIRKSGSYPTDPTDGTALYNGTLEYYNDTTVDYDVHKYTIFSWNDTVDRWSSGFNIPTGFLRVSVFDENTSLPLNNWSIHVSNQAGTLVYEQIDCSNPTTIDNSELPTGLCSILINHSDYESRIYYMTIVTAQGHFLNAYLPEKNTTTNYYVILVYNEYNEPLDDVYVQISEYDNTSGTFNDVSSRYTDAYGEISVYLIGGKHYKVNLTKDEFKNIRGADYFPDPNYYGINHPKFFKMYYNDTIYMNETIYEDTITVTGEISGTDFVVTFNCDDNNMENTSLIIYEINGSTGVTVAVDWYNTTSSNSWTRTYFDINTSNCFQAVLYLNHTIFGSYVDTRIDCVISTITTKNKFDTLLINNFKYNPFGWSNVFGFVILVFTMFSFGQQHVALSMFMSGGVIAFINTVVGLNLVQVAVPTVIICLGIMVLWSERGRR